MSMIGSAGRGWMSSRYGLRDCSISSARASLSGSVRVDGTFSVIRAIAAMSAAGIPARRPMYSRTGPPAITWLSRLARFVSDSNVVVTVWRLVIAESTGSMSTRVDAPACSSERASRPGGANETEYRLKTVAARAIDAHTAIPRTVGRWRRRCVAIVFMRVGARAAFRTHVTNGGTVRGLPRATRKSHPGAAVDHAMGQESNGTTPLLVERTIALAREHRGAGRRDEAELLYAQVLGVAPDHVDAACELALLLRARGDAAGAAALLRRTLGGLPGEPRLRDALAEIDPAPAPEPALQATIAQRLAARARPALVAAAQRPRIWKYQALSSCPFVSGGHADPQPAGAVRRRRGGSCSARTSSSAGCAPRSSSPATATSRRRAAR